MRVLHNHYRLPGFPAYSSAFLSQNELVLGGGGGTSKSGIKNKLRIFKIGDDRSIELKEEFELGAGEDAPMSMATDGKTIVCGVNSAEELLKKGENENCRVFGITDGKLSSIRTRGTLSTSPTELDGYQKVTVLSPDGSLLAVAGPNDFSLLSYPSLIPVAQSVHLDNEIYDATFSNSKLIIATTMNLHVYSLPETSSVTPSKSKKKVKQKASMSLTSLVCERVLDIPDGSSGSTFRAAKIHPTVDNALYTVVNTKPSRTRGKSPQKYAHVSKWNMDTWTVEKTRKVGDRNLTCFSISPDGKLLGCGSSDLAIGLLDATTLNPVSTILKAHEFPPTTMAFNTTSTLLVSGSADNTIRVISLPSHIRGSNWGFMVLLILTLIIMLLAFIVQRYSSDLGILN